MVRCKALKETLPRQVSVQQWREFCCHPLSYVAFVVPNRQTGRSGLPTHTLIAQTHPQRGVVEILNLT